jgi:hypothetical protein
MVLEGTHAPFLRVDPASRRIEVLDTRTRGDDLA